MWDLGLLAFGLAGLWVGTEVVLRSTLALAERWGLSQALLGMTLLAFGTDLPELVVAIDGAMHELRGIDASGVVVGNAVGSAIAQGTLVLGMAGLVGLLQLSMRSLRRDGITLGLAISLFAVLAADGRVERIEGAVLVIAYAIYLATLIGSEWVARVPREADSSARAHLLGIAGGLVAVLVAAELVVSQALVLAEQWQVSQGVVGVLVVGAGTSLPELVLSIGAAAKGRASLSVGNVIGSNIFDLLIPVGVGSLIAPMAVAGRALAFDLGFLALATIAMIVFFLWRNGLQRREAGVLVAMYLAYAIGRFVLD